MTAVEHARAGYPCPDEVFHDRAVWALGEDGDMGFAVEGHGRRALAAANAKGRDIDRWDWRRQNWAGSRGPLRVSETWELVIETCGCTPEQHAQHVVAMEAVEDEWVDCSEHCEHFGLPPCRDDYGWTSKTVPAGTPDAVAMTEVRW